MQNTVYTITGKKGSGKSYTAAKIADQYFTRSIKDYIIIIDNDQDYIMDKELHFLNTFVVDRTVPGKSINYEKVISVYQYVIFEVRDLTKKERDLELNKILNAIYNLKNALVITDESHRFFSKNSPPEEYERIITGGRSAAIDQIYIVQRVQMMNLLCLSLSDVLITFREQEKNAQKRLAEYLPGVSNSEIGDLGKYEFYIKYRDQVDRMSTNVL